MRGKMVLLRDEREESGGVGAVSGCSTRLWDKEKGVIQPRGNRAKTLGYGEKIAAGCRGVGEPRGSCTCRLTH